jgi:uncharacterized OsmC-like protein
LRCEVAAGDFSILVDEPEADGGTGAAPQPTDLLLAAAASCFTLALVHSAAKRAISLRSLRVDVVGHYAGNRFDRLHLSVDAAGPNDDELANLLQAAQRVCYVTNTLRTAVTIDIGSRQSQ